MNKQELEQFIKWLPSNINEFKDKSPEEIVTILNKLSQTGEGIDTISKLINQFKQNMQSFKNGGKINYIINKFQTGGQFQQRKFNILDTLNLKQSIPINKKFIGLQNKFNTQKFANGGAAESKSDIRKRGDNSKTTHVDNTVTFTEELPYGIRQTLIRPNGDRTTRDITFDRDTTFTSYPINGKSLVLNRILASEMFNPNSSENDISQDNTWYYYNTNRLMNKWGETFNKYFPKHDEYLK